MKRQVLTAVLGAVLCSTSWAQEGAKKEELDRSKPVPMGPARPFKPAPVQEGRLSSGVKVSLIESRRFSLVSLNIILPFAGSAFDPEGRGGLANLVTALLTEGTAAGPGPDSPARDSNAMAEAIDNLGGSVSVGVMADAAMVSIFVEKKMLESALALARDMLRSPSFSPEEADKVRQKALAMIRERKGDPDNIASSLLSLRIFGSHPYREATTEKTIKAINLNNLADFHQRNFGPQGAIIAASGDVGLEELKALGEKYFGDWKAPAFSPVIREVPPAPAPPKPEGIDLVDQPGSQHSLILVGHLSISRDSPDYAAVSVMNFILGGGSMESRLVKNLREDHGWAYGAGSSVTPLRRGGLFSANASVQKDKTGPAVTEILKEIKRLRDEAVSAEELEKAKRIYAGAFVRGQQMIQNMAGQVSYIELYGLPKDSLAVFKTKIDALTTADIQAAARKHLRPDDLAIVVVGDAAAVYSQLAALGPVRVFDVNGKPKGMAEPVLKPVSPSL